MNFGLTEEQNLLRDSVAAYLRDRYDFAHRRAIVSSERGFDTATWHAFAEQLGILALGVPEASGGIGGGAVDHMVVMEELGRALVIEPYLETLVVGAGLLARAGTPQALAVLEGIPAGSGILALAYLEPQGRFDPFDVQTAARRDGDGYRLNGHKALVLGAPWASHFIVSARLGGAQKDNTGIGLFLVDASAAGVVRRDYPTIDGRRASELYFEDARLPVDCLLVSDASAQLEQALDEGIAALCAEGIGVLKFLQETTVAYVKQRKQFGKAIGDFQVVRHRLVDMHVAIEQLVSLTYAAVIALNGPVKERIAAVSAAKIHLASTCRLVGQGAVQLHGGMGQTDELAVGAYFKRATAMESQFGSADFHARRYRATMYSGA